MLIYDTPSLIYDTPSLIYDTPSLIYDTPSLIDASYVCLQLYDRWGDSARLLVEDIPEGEGCESGGSGVANIRVGGGRGLQIYAPLPIYDTPLLIYA